jgi:hypothetical protein
MGSHDVGPPVHLSVDLNLVQSTSRSFYVDPLGLLNEFNCLGFSCNCLDTIS